jgi:hypothetical protein
MLLIFSSYFKYSSIGKCKTEEKLMNLCIANGFTTIIVPITNLSSVISFVHKLPKCYVHCSVVNSIEFLATVAEELLPEAWEI